MPSWKIDHDHIQRSQPCSEKSVVKNTIKMPPAMAMLAMMMDVANCWTMVKDKSNRVKAKPEPSQNWICVDTNNVQIKAFIKLNWWRVRHNMTRKNTSDNVLMMAIMRAIFLSCKFSSSLLPTKASIQALWRELILR